MTTTKIISLNYKGTFFLFDMKQMLCTFLIKDIPDVRVLLAGWVWSKDQCVTDTPVGLCLHFDIMTYIDRSHSRHNE